MPAVLIEQARESGKPDNIIEKMIIGRMNKFYQEVVFVEQTFVIDGEKVPVILLPERNTIMDDLLSGFEMKYWWL